VADPVTAIQEQEALKQLGNIIPGDVSGGDVFGGMLQLLMGFATGQAGQGTGTQTVSQHSQQQQQKQFIQQMLVGSQAADHRIPTLLEKAGTVIGGSEAAGDEWSGLFKGAPKFAQQMVQTMFNQSPLGQLTGGDPTALAHGAQQMLRGSNNYSDVGGMGEALGGQFSPQRQGLVNDINKEVMQHFQDPDTGLPIMDRTQGQSFDNIGKFVQLMGEQGGIKADDLVEEVDSGSGSMKLNTKALDQTKTKIKEGMELFRNLNDVFGSSDFNELMSQAERLAGLDMADPSSIKKSLGAVRNARGIAQSMGMDERKALGDLAAANDTMVSMGVDRRTAAAYNLQSFTGAMAQGQMNVQGNDPFDTGYRRKMGPTEMMQYAAISNSAMLAEAEARPQGEVSQSQMLRMYMSKPRDNLSPELKAQIESALEEADPAKRKQAISAATAAVEQEAGISLTNMSRELGLGNLREMQDSDTLDAMAKDNRRTLLTRNKQRFRNNYMRHEFNMPRIRQELQEATGAEEQALNEDEDVISLTEERTVLEEDIQRLTAAQAELPEGDTAREELEDEIAGKRQRIDAISSDAKVSRRDEIQNMRTRLKDFEDVMVNAPDTVGLKEISKLAAIAEGREGQISYRDEDGNIVKENAAEMDEAQRERVIRQKLDDRGVEGAEADKITSTLMDSQNLLSEIEKTTGLNLNSLSKGSANLNELLGPEMTAFLTSEYSIREGTRAGADGAATFEGGPAMKDPLQNFLFGVLGADAKAEKTQAWKDEQAEDPNFSQGLSVNALTTTNTQKALFDKLSSTTDPEERAELAEAKETKVAMTDMVARLIPQLEEVTTTDKDGVKRNLVETILDSQGVKDPAEAIDKFKKDMATAARLDREGKTEEANKLREDNLATFQTLVGELGGTGESTGEMGLLQTLRKQGTATNVRKQTKEEVAKEIEDLDKEISLEQLKEMGTQREKRDAVEQLEEQRSNIQDLEKDLIEGVGKSDEEKAEIDAKVAKLEESKKDKTVEEKEEIDKEIAALEESKESRKQAATAKTDAARKEVTAAKMELVKVKAGGGDETPADPDAWAKLQEADKAAGGLSSDELMKPENFITGMGVIAALGGPESELFKEMQALKEEGKDDAEVRKIMEEKYGPQGGDAAVKKAEQKVADAEERLKEAEEEEGGPRLRTKEEVFAAIDEDEELTPEEKLRAKQSFVEHRRREGEGNEDAQTASRLKAAQRTIDKDRADKAGISVEEQIARDEDSIAGYLTEEGEGAATAEIDAKIAELKESKKDKTVAEKEGIDKEIAALKESRESTTKVDQAKLDEAKQKRADAAATFTDADRELIAADEAGDKPAAVIAAEEELRHLKDGETNAEAQKVVDEYNQSVEAAKQKKKDAEDLIAQADILDEEGGKDKADELDAARDKLAELEDKAPTESKQELDNKIFEAVKTTIMDPEEKEVSDDEKQALLKHVEEVNADAGKALTESEVRKGLRDNIKQLEQDKEAATDQKEKDRIQGEIDEKQALLNTARDVFDVEEREKKEELQDYTKDGRHVLDIADQGAEDLEKRKAFNKELRVKSGQRAVDLAKSLGVEGIMSEELADLESGLGVGETKEQLESDIAKLEESKKSKSTEEIKEIDKQIAELEESKTLKSTEEIKEIDKQIAELEESKKGKDTEEVKEIDKQITELEESKTSKSTEEINEIDKQIAELEESKTSKSTAEIKEIDKQIEEKKSQLEESKKLTSGTIEKFQEKLFTKSTEDAKDDDDINDFGDTGDDLISKLADRTQSKGLVETFETAGMDKTDVLDGLKQAEAEVTKERDAAKEGSSERKRADERLAEIQKAQQNVRKEFGAEETGGLLVELIDKLNQLLGGKALKVTMENP